MSELINKIFSAKGFFEVAIKSRPEWDLSSQPLNSVQMLCPTSISVFVYSLDFILTIALVIRHIYRNRIITHVMT